MKVLSLFLLFVCASLASAQTVPSSCDAPDSVREKYMLDASQLALRRVFEIDSPYADSAILPQVWKDSAMRALLAVYNADMPATDTIFTLLRNNDENTIYTIHTFPYTATNGISIAVDTNYQWVKNLRDSVIPTGNATFDSLLLTFGFYPTHSIMLTPYLRVSLATDIGNNMKVIGGIFDSVEGVLSAAYGAPRGDGPDILFAADDSLTYLTYIGGWGDCPAGCTERHYWYFSIFPDCSVRLDSSYGDPPRLLKVNQFRSSELSLYPNPVTNKLIIEAEERGTAIISDVSGKEIQNTSIIEGKNELLVSDLPGGIYFVTIRDKNGNVTTGRFIKM